MTIRRIAAAALIVTATSALAHKNVQNAAVKARMAGMTAIGADMKTLGNMAKRKIAFDRAAARAAAAGIAGHAADIPALFKAPETDPKSEARPAIWTNFPDFSQKAGALETLARDLSGSIAGPDDIGPAVSALGAACGACHKPYRE